MSNTAIFDAGYLARRAFFAMGRRARFPNSTIFGFLRDVLAACDFLQAETAAFCFDSTESERRRIYADYKISRNRRYQKMTTAERVQEAEFHIDVARLPQILNTIGYQNVFYQKGYEADDLMASAVGYFPGRLFLVSADKDLWQLISERVSCWNPQTKKLMSLRGFYKIYGIEPDDWIRVKSIAGCNTDDIPGVPGVGDVTAAKYLRGELKADSMAFERIGEAEEMISRNRVLVRLPFPGTQNCEPQINDRPTPAGWRAAASDLDMPGLHKLLERAAWQKNA